MLPAALPENEPQRLKAVCGLNILDTPAEERFDRITRIAQALFNVPIALVSLVDAQRQWFKSRQGLDVTETPRDISFCGHVILGDDVFYVPNALLDPRFFDNPLVTGPPEVRFYAGAPLAGPDGSKIGSLCIMDRQARTMSAQDFCLLRDLADCVERELELTRLQLLAIAKHSRESRLRTVMDRRVATSQESRLRAVLDNVVDGIITLDVNGCIETFNPAAERIFGYKAGEVIGQNVKLLMHESYHAEHDGYLDHYVKTGETRMIGTGREVLGRRKNDSSFPMELAVSEMKLDDQTLFTGIVRDITERKRDERMKSEFVSTVSHELRTPLTSIRGALSLVLGKHSSDLPEKVRRLLDTAKRNSERLTLLINDILDLEKFESGQMELDLKSLDLVALVRQAITANEGYAHEHAVHLRLVEAPEAASVRADGHRMSQVFSNLLSNAIKYSSKNGQVEISVRARDQTFRVSVRDHGRGIPQEFRSRMFQRFSQADSSDTREKGGTGLGLSITKAIVEQHHGHIDYFSVEGEGADFFFDLPAWHEIAEQVEARDGRQCMLICEDNPDVAMVLSELLEHEGIASDRAATAAGAIDLLRRNTYRALLLDLGLPDMDGSALIQQLRGDEATRDLPIIVVSGRAPGDSGVWHGEAWDVLDWLQKPVDRERLRQALAQALRKNKLPRVLHVEDDADVVEVIRSLLEDTVDYAYANSLAHARQQLEQEHFDLVLLDLFLPDGSGAELLNAIGLGTQVVIFSGQAPSNALSRQVNAVLTKATTSNERLLATIKNVLNRNGVGR